MMSTSLSKVDLLSIAGVHGVFFEVFTLFHHFAENIQCRTSRGLSSVHILNSPFYVVKGDFSQMLHSTRGQLGTNATTKQRQRLIWIFGPYHSLTDLGSLVVETKQGTTVSGDSR